MAQVSNLEIVIGANVDGFNDKIKSVKDQIASLTELQPSLNKLAGAFDVISVAVLAFASAAIYAAAKTDELRQGLNNVGGQGTTQFAALTVESNKLGIGVESVAKAAIRLEAAGISNKTTLSVINGIGEAVRKMGGGETQFNGVIGGLERIAATGHIAGRAIKTIELNAPEMKEVLVKAFGTDVPKAIEAMGLTTEQFMKRMSDAAAGITPHVRTLQDSFVQLKNTVLTSMGSLGDTLSKDVNLTGIIDGISNGIKNLISWFQGLPPDARKVIEVLAGIVVVIGPLIGLFSAIITIAPALGAAWAVAFGPIGIAVAAITVAVVLIVNHFDRFKQVLMYVAFGMDAFAAVSVEAISVVLQWTDKLIRVFTLGIPTGLDYTAKALDKLGVKLQQRALDTKKLAEELGSLAHDQELFDAAKEKSDEAAAKNHPAVELGGGGKGKAKKEKEERIADIQVIGEAVTFAQLQDDEKRFRDRQLNFERLFKLAKGETVGRIMQDEKELLALQTNLNTNTANSLLQLKKTNDDKYWTASKFGEKRIYDQLQEFNKQMNQIIANGMVEVGSQIGAGLAKAFEKGNFKDLGAGLMSAMGGVMVQLGQAAIGLGVTILLAKKALSSLNPWLAIAGGIALVAAGSAFSDAASSAGNSSGSIASSASSGSSPSSGSDGNLAALQAMVSNSNKQSLVATVNGNQLAFVLSKSSTRSSN